MRERELETAVVFLGFQLRFAQCRLTVAACYRDENLIPPFVFIGLRARARG
jgi:hypothetical protein